MAISVPDVIQTAKLFDITINKGDKELTFTVFLDSKEIKNLLLGLVNKSDNTEKNMAEYHITEREIEEIFITPDRQNNPIIHMFNTSYDDISLMADNIHQAGFGYVMVSPPLTWQKDGPKTPAEAKDMWYHCYQPEDSRAIDNPLGNKQSFILMINILKARGIDVIADVPLNFMGVGGEGGAGGNDGKGTLQYPSINIIEKREEKKSRVPGQVEAQQIIYSIGTNPQDLTQHYLSSFDFEPGRHNFVHSEKLEDIQSNRLEGLPKKILNNYTKSEMQTYLNALKECGVKGFRIDAEKHMKEGMLNNVFTTEITEGIFIFGEVITNGMDNSWEYLQTRLSTLKDIGAYDFPLQKFILKAFSFSGDLRDLRSTENYNPGKISPAQSVTFTVNHDIPNNKTAFSHLLFSDPIDEMLAYSYLMALPGNRTMVYYDGKALTSNTDGHPEWTNALQNNQLKNLIFLTTFFITKQKVIITFLKTLIILSHFLHKPASLFPAAKTINRIQA